MPIQAENQIFRFPPLSHPSAPPPSIGKGVGVLALGEGCGGGEVEKVWDFNEILRIGYILFAGNIDYPIFYLIIFILWIEQL